MKNPCELIIWYVLPDLRSEITKYLIDNYSIKQTEAAEIFGVTRAAINQYLSSKRGSGLFSTLKTKKQATQLQKEINLAAQRIYEDNSRVNQELCRVCGFIRNSNIINEIYLRYENGNIPDWICNIRVEPRTTSGVETGNCPHCNGEIQAHWKACPSCGNKLFNNCPKCKAEVNADWKACPHCGEKIIKK
ncbi:MAG: zinc ribbon domain-containing protein [Thermoplasmata archaeon]|nr:zinc ribbon domain-containing protein [Thermoplasmata archaeon]